MAEDTRAGVLDEHRRITNVLQRIEQWVVDPKTGAGWTGELGGMLEELQGLLKEHFGGEAEAKLFEQTIASTPHLTALLTKLAKEHSQILAAFRAAFEQAQTLDAAKEQEVRGLQRKVQLALATLRRHESEENEIIMRAYWEDMGGGD